MLFDVESLNKQIWQLTIGICDDDRQPLLFSSRLARDSHSSAAVGPYSQYPFLDWVPPWGCMGDWGRGTAQTVMVERWAYRGVPQVCNNTACWDLSPPGWGYPLEQYQYYDVLLTDAKPHLLSSREDGSWRSRGGGWVSGRGRDDQAGCLALVAFP